MHAYQSAAAQQPALVLGTAVAGSGSIASYALAFVNQAAWMTLESPVASAALTVWATYMISASSPYFTNPNMFLTLFGSTVIDFSLRFCASSYSGAAEGYVLGCANSADFLVGAPGPDVFLNSNQGALLPANPQGQWNYLSATAGSAGFATYGVNMIGNTVLAYGRAFDGYVAEMVFYTTTLAYADHLQLYAQRIQSTAPPPAPPAPPPPPPLPPGPPATAAAAVAAFSTRRVVGGYAGPVVRVRHGSTGAATDLYPVDQGAPLGFDLVLPDLSTTYSSWIGAATGYVTVWYDQTGARKIVFPGGSEFLGFRTYREPRLCRSG